MRRLLPLLYLTAFILLIFRQAAFSNLIFARGDLLLYFYPYWDYRAQAFLAGQLPLWNPYLFMGVPFLANSQAGVFYPLNWPLMFFAAPVAVKIAIIIHLIIAALGTYLLARAVFALQPSAAAFAATLFAASGYLLAQVEHVNQVQGLAWLPWALWATYQAIGSQALGLRKNIFSYSLLSLFIALQLTAGHTQTAFITLVVCTIVALYYTISHQPSHFASLRGLSSAISPIIVHYSLFSFFIALGFALAAAQLLPTFELSQLSLRSGGLAFNEAVSFSLHPLLIGRALLPPYSRVIFSEFVSYVGVIPLTLAIVSLTEFRRQKLIILAALIAFTGLFLALGGYNPLYWLLVRFGPGFNLFRVPARWLVLFALGASLLAGYGLQSIISNPQSLKKILFASTLPLALIALTFFSANLQPAGETGVLGLPSWNDVILWFTPLLVLVISNWLLAKSYRVTNYYLLFTFAIIELLLAANALPLNHLTTPDSYTSVRPAMTQLLAAKNDSTPPGRFLSLSSLEFDPGDMAELKSAWDWQLPASEVYDAIVATKHKELLSPNLPMTWGLAAVDGYDGGLLPLKSYAEFIKQLGATGATTDGRLRQMLKGVPPNPVLSLINTQYLITDKSGDAWLDGVFYDLQFAETVTPAKPLTLDRLPRFSANAIGLVLAEGQNEGEVKVTLSDGNTVTQTVKGSGAVRVKWERASTVKAITISSASALTLRGATLIDEKAEAFQWLTLGAYRLVHSGDTKIYQNLNVLPRAFIIPNLQSPIANYQRVTIIKYEPEHIVIQTQNDQGGYLILTDAVYPGWVSSVDGQEVKIETAFGLFRAITLPTGSHTVEFILAPTSLKVGGLISAIALIIWLVLLGGSLFQRYPV